MRKTLRLWLGQARATVLLGSGIVVVVVEWTTAPRAWDIVTYAQSYARPHVTAGYWSECEALLWLAPTYLQTWGLMFAIAAIPFILGWLLGRISPVNESTQ